MLFSFSSSSFHSSFPPPAPDSLLTTCETYAVWLTLQICCIHYLVIVHICFCHSLSLYIPSLCLMSLMMINLIFSVFAQFVLATSFFFFLPPSAHFQCSGRSHFICASFLSCITIIITPFTAPLP